jgi:hypothetical protein
MSDRKKIDDIFNKELNQYKDIEKEYIKKNKQIVIKNKAFTNNTVEKILAYIYDGRKISKEELQKDKTLSRFKRISDHNDKHILKGNNKDNFRDATASYLCSYLAKDDFQHRQINVGNKKVRKCAPTDKKAFSILKSNMTKEKKDYPGTLFNNNKISKKEFECSKSIQYIKNAKIENISIKHYNDNMKKLTEIINKHNDHLKHAVTDPHCNSERRVLWVFNHLTAFPKPKYNPYGQILTRTRARIHMGDDRVSRCKELADTLINENWHTKNGITKKEMNHLTSSGRKKDVKWINHVEHGYCYCRFGKLESHSARKKKCLEIFTEKNYNNHPDRIPKDFMKDTKKDTKISLSFPSNVCSDKCDIKGDLNKYLECSQDSAIKTRKDNIKKKMDKNIVEKDIIEKNVSPKSSKSSKSGKSVKTKADIEIEKANAEIAKADAEYAKAMAKIKDAELAAEKKSEQTFIEYIISLFS